MKTSRTALPKNVQGDYDQYIFSKHSDCFSAVFTPQCEVVTQDNGPLTLIACLEGDSVCTNPKRQIIWQETLPWGHLQGHTLICFRRK